MTSLQKKGVFFSGLIALVFILYFGLPKGISMYQYRLQGDDVQKYEECLEKYHEDIDNYITEKNDIGQKYHIMWNYKSAYEELSEKIETMYSSTRNWPEKYKELYFYTFMAFRYWVEENAGEVGSMAKDYDAINQWDKIWMQLENQLENKYYVPEDLEKYKKEMQELLGDEKLPEYVRVQ